MASRPEPEPTGPGQESVWDYPRPAIAVPCASRLEVLFDGRLVADTRRGVRTLETSHPPTYYFPIEDVDTELLHPNRARRSLCEWKGQASYFDVVSGSRAASAAAWSYLAPTPSFAILAGHVAFYLAPMDACRVDGETASAQPGGFYGGWVTSGVVGPFKGEPGTAGW